MFSLHNHTGTSALTHDHVLQHSGKLFYRAVREEDGKKAGREEGRKGGSEGKMEGGREEGRGRRKGGREGGCDGLIY